MEQVKGKQSIWVPNPVFFFPGFAFRLLTQGSCSALWRFWLGTPLSRLSDLSEEEVEPLRIKKEKELLMESHSMI
jgi:hypothetical protein